VNSYCTKLEVTWGNYFEMVNNEMFY